MSLKLEIQKKSLERSPRVKALDFHHDNTWVVSGLYSGTITLHDYSTNVYPILHRPVSEQ
jgi:coatomer subunit beta'